MKTKILLLTLAIINTTLIFAQYEGNGYSSVKDSEIVFCQIPSFFNNYNTSSVETEKIVVQHLNVQNIYAILFYGAKFALDEPIACNSDELKFIFKIFEDNSGVVGNEIVGLRDSANLVATATGFNIGEIDVAYYWQYYNTNLIDLPESYFLGIQSSSSECKFLWASGPDNIIDDLSYKFNPDTEVWDELNLGLTICIEDSLTDGITTNRERKLEIFPNPAQSSINIKTDKIYEIEIANINGQILSSFKMGKTEQTICISQFEKGVYFIRFLDRDDTFVKKIVIY